MEKRRFQIITDSGSDLPQEYFSEHNVECVKLGFLMEGVDYFGESGNEIDAKVFYEKLRNGALPTTYQITPETARTHIQPYLEKGEDVLVVAFSSGLSGTANSFILAAKLLSEEYPERKVLVVDSLCASLGQGLFVHYVVEKADTGASIEETFDYAENLKLKINHQFTVDNLFHLKRGGRVSTTAAVVGTMLNVKPTLHVNDEGKLIATGKVIGRKRSLKRLVEKMLRAKDIDENDWIFISHGDCLEEAEYVKEQVQKEFPNNKFLINYIGPVIGSHSGNGTVALFFKATER